MGAIYLSLSNNGSTSSSGSKFSVGSKLLWLPVSYDSGGSSVLACDNLSKCSGGTTIPLLL
jgi:hypothetical protein